MKQNTLYGFDKSEELTVMFYLSSLAFWTLSRKSWIAVSFDFPCVESFVILVIFFIQEIINYDKGW